MLLLISGSRNSSASACAYARKAVERAHELGYSVIVGEAPGVDHVVMSRCHQLAVPCTVVGAHGRLRARTPYCIPETVSGGYIERDRYMAEQCDICLAIWNGKSRGTKATYDFAVGLGKTAWLKIFKEVVR